MIGRFRSWWRPTLDIPTVRAPELSFPAVITTNHGVTVELLELDDAMEVANYLAWVDSLPEAPGLEGSR